MKKIISIFTILIFLIPSFYVPTVKAKTLGDLKKELENKQNELSQNQQQQNQTQQQIDATNQSIENTKKSIEGTYQDIADLDKEIENLNLEIEEKEKEMKEIMSYVQVSSGESAYLEYAFGAKDFTDFIYRMAVAEQLTTYNDDLIKKYNQMIEESKQKQKEIEEKRVQLSQQQEELQQKVKSLGQELEDLESVNIDIEDDIAYQREIIEMYKNKGCKDHEDIATCGRAALPAGTAFYRPTLSGFVISEWGTRYFMGKTFHEGLDVSIPEGTPVYAIGNGMVATLMIKNSCGGNMVVVHHNINGKTYTSVYAHLLSINVQKEQIVNRNTIIGYSGGQSTKSYDRCTSGAHLHLTVATGFYGDYNWYQMNYVYSIDPRSVINFPSGRNYWYDRITAY